MYTDRVRRRTFKDSSSIPEGYVLATDDDFSGTSNGRFRYIGNDLKIVIPNRIKGIAVTSYAAMFASSSVTGVVSYNKNIISMTQMFNRAQATSLDLSSFDTSNVTDMSYMFQLSRFTTLDLRSFDTSSVINMRNMFYNSFATSLDLSSFDTSNVTDMSWMFLYSITTTGYARTQADADNLNASSNKPSILNFVVKP